MVPAIGNFGQGGRVKRVEFAGDVSNGNLTKAGPGLLILGGAVADGVALTVSGGTLQGTTDNLKGNIVNNGQVVFWQDVDGTYSGNMSGNGSVEKNGSGRATYPREPMKTASPDEDQLFDEAVDLFLAEDGAVMVRDAANPEAPPQQIDRLKLANWRGTDIAKGLDGLFRVTGGGVLPADADARLAPATLEQSNVRPSEVLVEMVEAQRLYDMRTKLVATAKELDEGSASLMRLS